MVIWCNINTLNPLTMLTLHNSNYDIIISMALNSTETRLKKKRKRKNITFSKVFPRQSQHVSLQCSETWQAPKPQAVTGCHEYPQASNYYKKA